MNKTKERIDSLIASMLTRKFLLSVLGSLMVVFNYLFGWGLTIEQITAILTPLGGFVVFEGIADIVQRAQTSSTSTSIVKTSQNGLQEDDSPDTSEIFTGKTRVKSFDEKEPE